MPFDKYNFFVVISRYLIQSKNTSHIKFFYSVLQNFDTFT